MPRRGSTSFDTNLLAQIYVREEHPESKADLIVDKGDIFRHGVGLYVLALTGDRICAMTRFENSVLPWFGLPRSLPSR